MDEIEQERREARLLFLGEHGTCIMEILDKVLTEAESAGLGGHEFRQGVASAINDVRGEVRRIYGDRGDREA